MVDTSSNWRISKAVHPKPVTPKKEPQKGGMFSWLKRENRFYLLKIIILLLPVTLAISLRITDPVVWVFFGSLLAYISRREMRK